MIMIIWKTRKTTVDVSWVRNSSPLVDYGRFDGAMETDFLMMIRMWRFVVEVLRWPVVDSTQDSRDGKR